MKWMRWKSSSNFSLIGSTMWFMADTNSACLSANIQCMLCLISLRTSGTGDLLRTIGNSPRYCASECGMAENRNDCVEFCLELSKVVFVVLQTCPSSCISIHFTLLRWSLAFSSPELLPPLHPLSQSLNGLKKTTTDQHVNSCLPSNQHLVDYQTCNCDIYENTIWRYMNLRASRMKNCET